MPAESRVWVDGESVHVDVVMSGDTVDGHVFDWPGRRFEDVPVDDLGRYATVKVWAGSEVEHGSAGELGDDRDGGDESEGECACREHFGDGRPSEGGAGARRAF